MKSIVFKDIETLSFCGDIHGKWEELGFQIVEKHSLGKSITVCCGDIGLGWGGVVDQNQIERLRKLNRRIAKNKNHVVWFRGNHDNPFSYIDNAENRKLYKPLTNIHIVPDYTVLEVNNRHHILCIGGSMSIDRTQRVVGKSYWVEEPVRFDNDELNKICIQYGGLIDIVATHNRPLKCCYPTVKDGLMGWTTYDSKIESDVDACDAVSDKIFTYLSNNSISPVYWYYGHYHQHHTEDIEMLDPVLKKRYVAHFTLLNCNEIFEHKDEQQKN